jgi:hypothetical protein
MSADGTTIYQHKSVEADQAIADALSESVKKERKKPGTTRRGRIPKPPDDPDDGAAGVLARVG